MKVNEVLTDDGEQRTDLDSHADTCVIGQNELIVQNLNRPVNVVGYDPSKGIMTLNYQTVSAAVEYDCPMKGKLFILEVNQAILIDHFHNNIMFTMQMRMYGVKVNEIPKSH